jgi:endonuclease/exonuclease/phosphatase family metal-dependent hydrolase
MVIGPPAKGARLHFVERAGCFLRDAVNPFAQLKWAGALAGAFASSRFPNATSSHRSWQLRQRKSKLAASATKIVMIRLLTYNIHKGIGGRDRRCRLERIIEIIADEKPDIVCLQEVTQDARRTRRQHQPNLLAEALQMPQSLFQMNVRYRRGGYGNLLLCRWGIIQDHHLCLRNKTRKPRGAQLAVIDTPQGKLMVVNWHLGLSDRERLWQAQRLLTHAPVPLDDGLPVLLAGDTNDWRGRLAKGPLAAHGFRELTTPSGRFRTFPAWLPTGALDKCFARGPIHAHRVKRVISRQARIASDHLPLVVDFEIR